MLGVLAESLSTFYRFVCSLDSKVSCTSAHSINRSDYSTTASSVTSAQQGISRELPKR